MEKNTESHILIFEFACAFIKKETDPCDSLSLSIITHFLPAMLFPWRPSVFPLKVLFLSETKIWETSPCSLPDTISQKDQLGEEGGLLASLMEIPFHIPGGGWERHISVLKVSDDTDLLMLI